MQMYKKVAYKCMTSHLRCMRNAAPFCSLYRFNVNCLHSALFICTALIFNSLSSVDSIYTRLHFLYTRLHFLYTPQKERNAFCIGSTILRSRQTTMSVTGGRIFGCSYSKAALPIQPQTNAITAFTTQPWQAVYYVPMATTRRKVENSAVQTVV